MLHCLARLRAASLVLIATLTPLALANTEILVSRLPFELADLPNATYSAQVYVPVLASALALSAAHRFFISSPHILEVNSPQTLSVRLNEGQKSPKQLFIPLDGAGTVRTGLLGLLDRFERAMGLDMRTVRLSWPASVRTAFYSIESAALTSGSRSIRPPSTSQPTALPHPRLTLPSLTCSSPQLPPASLPPNITPSTSPSRSSSNRSTSAACQNRRCRLFWC